MKSHPAVSSLTPPCSPLPPLLPPAPSFLSVLPGSTLSHYPHSSTPPHALSPPLPKTPRPAPLMASGRERWAITQHAAFQLSATCYANIINQSGPDCCCRNSRDLRVPAVRRYLYFLFLSTPPFTFTRSLSFHFFAEKKKNRKSSFTKGPQDGRLNDGHRSFSNKFHGAWSKDNSFSAPMTIQLLCQSKPTACCLIMIKSGCQLTH